MNPLLALLEFIKAVLTLLKEGQPGESWYRFALRAGLYLVAIATIIVTVRTVIAPLTLFFVNPAPVIHIHVAPRAPLSHDHGEDQPASSTESNLSQYVISRPAVSSARPFIFKDTHPIHGTSLDFPPPPIFETPQQDERTDEPDTQAVRQVILVTEPAVPNGEKPATSPTSRSAAPAPPTSLSASVE
jgi:hypothetical protein